MKSFLEQIRTELQSGLTALLGVPVAVRFSKYKQYGEFSTNLVMTLAGERGCPPAVISREILPNISCYLQGLQAPNGKNRQNEQSEQSEQNTNARLMALPERVAYAEPGFLNFYLKKGWQQAVLPYILETEEREEGQQKEFCGSAPLPQFQTFAIQYAYSRICNQLELLTELGYRVPAEKEVSTAFLTSAEEIDLLEQLAAPPDLESLSEKFHIFFNHCPIRGEPEKIAEPRMALLQACKRVFEIT